LVEAGLAEGDVSRFVLRRVLQSVLLLLIVSAIGFAILHLAPGGPLSQFMAGGDMRQEDIDRLTHQLGLDRPLPVQYLEWLWRMLHGDWGRSYRDQQPVLAVITSHLSATMELMLSSIMIAMLLGRCSTRWRRWARWWRCRSRRSGSGWW
jgi:peptide/nickel transport system permease protein